MQAIEAPSSLSPIDLIEIVDLRGLGSRIDSVENYMTHARSAPFAAVHGADAATIASLWRQLPSGKQRRCHIPPFGFRFFAGGRLVLEASVCWQCNNIYGASGGDKIFFEFEGSHPISRKLLEKAQRITGIRVTE